MRVRVTSAPVCHENVQGGTVLRYKKVLPIRYKKGSSIRYNDSFFANFFKKGSPVRYNRESFAIFFSNL